MSFVHPSILAATFLLAATPLLIHLLNRRRYRREPWAAMMFLSQAHRRSERRMRFDHWFLLAVRTLVVLLIGLTIARPYVSESLLGSAIGVSRFDRVIIIDDSLSMHSKRGDGRSSFEAAKSEALAIVDAAEPGDGLAIISACSPPKIWTRKPVRNRLAVRRIIESMECTAQTNDLPAALDAASKMLSASDAVTGCRVVHVMTDLSRPIVEGAAIGQSDKSIDKLYFVNVGPERRSNLAVSDLHYDAETVGSDIPLRVTVEVTNHSDTRSSRETLIVEIDGITVREFPMEALAADQTRTQVLELRVPGSGPRGITARIVSPVSDCLAVDNVRHLAIHPRGPSNKLLVENIAGGSSFQRSLFYYQVALSSDASPDTNGGYERTVTPGLLMREPLDRYAVVVLGNVGRMETETWERLERYVLRGGGLVLFLGDRIRAGDYQRSVFASDGMMPIRLERSFRVDSTDMLRFARPETDRPFFTDFVEHDQGGLFMAHVRRYWQVEADESSTGVVPLLRLSNGDPAILVKDHGRGRVVACLLDAGMKDSNLPSKPDYLPLMVKITKLAAGDSNAHRNVAVSEPLVEPVAIEHGKRRVPIQEPSGRMLTVTPDWRDGTPAVFHEATDHPGLYRLNLDEGDRLFAVNVDPRDSDVRTVSEPVLKRRFGPQAVLVDPRNTLKAAEMLPVEFTRFSTYLLVGLVLIEAVFASSRGRRP